MWRRALSIGGSRRRVNQGVVGVWGGGVRDSVAWGCEIEVGVERVLVGMVPFVG